MMKAMGNRMNLRVLLVATIGVLMLVVIFRKSWSGSSPTQAAMPSDEAIKVNKNFENPFRQEVEVLNAGIKAPLPVKEEDEELKDFGLESPELVPTTRTETVYKQITKIVKQPPFYERNITHYKPDEILLPYIGNAPDTVHILWCGKKWFEFKHFLAMTSVFKIMQPSKVVIHYWPGYPVIRDRNDYNLWFTDLKHEYYNIVERTRKGDIPECTDESAMTEQILDILKYGGVYMNDTLMVHKPMQDLRKYDFTMGVVDKNAPKTFSNIAYISAKPGKATKEALESYMVKDQDVCGKSDELTLTIERTNPSTYPRCLSVVKNSNPEKHMIANDTWSHIVRNMYYGSPAARPPSWSFDDPIANIGHMVLLGGYEMNLLTYLSIKSMIHCVGTDAMYVYIDTEPKGKWYEKLKAEEPRAVFVYHEWPGSVFGIKMNDGSHASDLMRFDLIYRFGGIYVDWDAIALKPLGHLRGYGFVTDFDWPDWHPPYPDVINNGVSAGKKGNKYLRMALHKFETYNPNGDWYYNGLMMPYKLYEQYPELVKIERKFQVICYNFKCHPVWLPNYHNENVDHTNESPFDWREVYAFHWTRPSPAELMDYDKLLENKTMFAAVGNYVLQCDREKTLLKIAEDEKNMKNPNV